MASDISPQIKFVSSLPLHGALWSSDQYRAYFSDDAHFAQQLLENGREVRKRMAELFSTLSSSFQSWVSFPPSGLNKEQVQRIFTVAQNAGLFSLNQLAKPNGHLFFDSFLEACRLQPSLAVPFIQNGLLVSEEGLDLIFKNSQKEALEALVEAKVALTPQSLKRLIHCACRVQSFATILALIERNLSPKYWEYGLQQCCLEGDQRAASFLLQALEKLNRVPLSIPPLFRALILGNYEEEGIPLKEKLVERFTLTSQTPFQLAMAFKNDKAARFFLEHSRMPLTISGTRIMVDHVALVSRSSVLEDMLRQEGSSLDEENCEAFLTIVSYLHTGELKKEEEHFNALLTVADKYGFTGLKEVFQEWLDEIPGIHPDELKRVAELKIPSLPQPPEIEFEADSQPLAVCSTEEDLLKKYSTAQTLLKEEFATACSKGWMGFLKCALTKEWIEMFDDSDQPLLLIASQEGNLELLHLLLRRGASPLIKLNKENSYLHWWADGTVDSEGYVPFMKALSDAIPSALRKEFVNHQNDKGETALDLASVCPETEGPLKVLLEAGADPWKVDKRGKTALHKMAAVCSSFVIPKMQCLLRFIPLGKRSQFVNLQDSAGNTALHKIFKDFGTGGDSELSCIEILLQAGADLFVKNEKGITPLQLPFSNINFSYAAIPMFRFLTPGQRDRLFHFAATLYPDDGVRGEDTPLHTLCKNGQLTYPELCADETQAFGFLKTTPNMASQRNQEGLLPLQIAIQNGAAHLIGPICGSKNLKKFKEFSSLK